jgi:predicted HTH domain antitoxin
MRKAMTNRYTENTKLSEVLNSPEASKIIAKYRLPCLHCAMAAYEAGILTLGQVSKIYGIDINGLLKELNEIS